MHDKEWRAICGCQDPQLARANCGRQDPQLARANCGCRAIHSQANCRCQANYSWPGPSPVGLGPQLAPNIPNLVTIGGHCVNKQSTLRAGAPSGSKILSISKKRAHPPQFHLARMPSIVLALLSKCLLLQAPVVAKPPFCKKLIGRFRPLRSNYPPSYSTSNSQIPRQ